MVKLDVDKAKVFFMLYKEARSFYDAFSAAEKKKLEESVETSMMYGKVKSTDSTLIIFYNMLLVALISPHFQITPAQL